MQKKKNKKTKTAEIVHSSKSNNTGQIWALVKTILKSLDVLVLSPGCCTKCSYQQQQTCFCSEEKLTQ